MGSSFFSALKFSIIVFILFHILSAISTQSLFSPSTLGVVGFIVIFLTVFLEVVLSKT